MFSLSKRSFQRMRGVHPALVACVCLAIRISEADFLVDRNAVRDKEYQAMLVRSGKSQTMNSMHLPQEDGYSHAIDLYPCGEHKDEWEEVHKAMVQAAFRLGIELTWGGEWKNFKDKPHYQLKEF